MRHFCTYFDSHYLPRGLALFRSLEKHCKRPFTLWILCFDDLTYQILTKLQLSHARLISREEFEADDFELRSVKGSRTLLEYYWTCTPSLPLFVLEKNPGIDETTYLDADLLFFSSPEPIYEEFSGNSILLIQHRYSPFHQEMERVVGKYNVQMMIFRRDDFGLKALRWWREQCLDWCSQKPENGKFGDQLYLNDWPQHFKRTHVLQHIGAGVGPWNAARYSLNQENGTIRVNNSPLIFYHFHALALVNDWIGVADKWSYDIPVDYLKRVYRPYFTALKNAVSEIRQVAPSFHKGYEAFSLREILRFIRQRKLLLLTNQ